MIGRIFALSLVFALWSAPQAWGFSDQGDIKTTRGFFALTPLLGQQNARLLNTNGSYSSFKGFSYGARMSVRVFGEGAGETHLFGIASSADLGSDQEGKLKNQELLYGVQFYSLSWLYFQLGYGSNQSEFTAAGDTVKMKYNVVGVGGGIEYPITDSLGLTLTGLYKNGQISRDQNQDLTNNSGFESFNVFFGLTWSPPLTTISLK